MVRAGRESEFIFSRPAMVRCWAGEGERKPRYKNPSGRMGDHLSVCEPDREESPQFFVVMLRPWSVRRTGGLGLHTGDRRSGVTPSCRQIRRKWGARGSNLPPPKNGALSHEGRGPSAQWETQWRASSFPGPPS